MIRSSVGQRSAVRLTRRALSTSTKGEHTAAENNGIPSGSPPQFLQEVYKPEQFSASVFVPGDVGSLLNLFAVIRETEKRFGHIAEFRCPTDPITNSPGARIFLRFASASSTATLPDSRSPERYRFLVPRPRPRDAPIRPEGDGWPDLLPFLQPYRGPVNNTPVDRAQASMDHPNHLRAEISYNPNAVGASPRLNWVDERKMRMVTHAMSGFSGFASTTTLAVQQTQAAWKERVKALDLKPYVPPPSWALSSPDDPGIDSTSSSDTGMYPSDSEGTTPALSPSVVLATSESEAVAEEEEELTPEESRELEERQRQTYLASRFAPAPALPLRDLRQKAEPPKSKAVLRRQRKSEKKAEIEANLIPPTSAIKTPAPTTNANPKNAKEAETGKQNTQKTSVQRQMKGLIASANKLGKQGSLVQQVAFKAEFSRQMRALRTRHKDLGRKIIQAKNRLAQIEQAKKEGLAAADQAAGHSGRQPSSEASVQDSVAETSEKQDNVSRGPRPLESLRSRIISLFGR